MESRNAQNPRMSANDLLWMCPYQPPGQIFLHKIWQILLQNMNTGLQDMQMSRIILQNPMNYQKPASTYIPFLVHNSRPYMQLE